MAESLLKIGELANLVGVTVRTLHHYHQIGLLIPSHMTEGGHRLYNEQDIHKTYHIISLKNFGFKLEEIRDMLHSVNINPLVLINLQLEKAQEALEQQQALYHLLKKLQQALKEQQSPSVKDMVEMIMIMQMNTTRYLTEEQIARLKNLYASLSWEEEQGLKEGWKSFLSQLDSCQKENKAFDSAEVKGLVAYWKHFLSSVTGNDKSIIDAGFKFHAENSNVYLNHGLTPELFQYLHQAVQANDEG